MENINKAKQTVAEIQEQLIDYLAAGEDTQDLTHLFSKLAVENPIAYELLLLMYQELQTKSKLDRKRLTKVIASILNQTNVVYDKLIDHEKRLIDEEENSTTQTSVPTTPNVASTMQEQANNIYEMVIRLLNMKTILSISFGIVIILTSLTALSAWHPEFIHDTTDSITKIFSSTPKK
jgi:hypothetical protein